MNLNNRELGSVLAGLRTWQAMSEGAPLEIEDIATGAGEHDMLSDDEIDALCERLNTEAPMSIEVSAIRRDAAGWETCNEDERSGEGFGVYIRAPYAMNVRDYLVPEWASQGADQFDDAKGAAFSFADTLAEHLGCDVVSQLKRPAAPAPRVDPELMREYIDAGASLWEAALALRNGLVDADGEAHTDALEWEKAFCREWNDFGTSHMRYTVGDFAQACHRDYIGACEHQNFGGSFDWDYCPVWLVAALSQRYLISQINEGKAFGPRKMVAGDVFDIPEAVATTLGIVAEVALRAAEGALVVGDTNCGGGDNVYSEPLALVRGALSLQDAAVEIGSEADWRRVVARGHTTQGYDDWRSLHLKAQAMREGGDA